MEWSDEAVVVGCSPHGEHHALLSLMTRSHGLWRGLSHGARTQKKRALVQLGAPVFAYHRARTRDQLGSFRLEPEALFTYRLYDQTPLYALTASCALINDLCPQHIPHQELFSSLCQFMKILGEKNNLTLAQYYACFEYDLLSHLGYGIDIACCALSSSQGNVAFVSKKSGRGIARTMYQEKWRRHLLDVPPFLSRHAAAMPYETREWHDIKQALTLTGYFLHQAHSHSLPQGRALLMRALAAHWSRTEADTPAPANSA